MRIIRLLGNVALWLGALLGVVAGGVWVADQLGWVQPLIVISGSMEPNIGTGDLLISRNLATADVEVGDVVSLRSEMTDKLVTHRVTGVAPNDDGTWTISMKGDANDEPDLETYTVDNSVLTPALQIPRGGKVVSKLMEPAVALPILLSLVALLGISLLDEPARPKAGRGRTRAEAALLDDGLGDDGLGDDDLGDDDVGDDDLGDGSMTTMEVEPVERDPIEDLDAALASVGALAGASVDGSVDASVEASLDVMVDASLDEPDHPDVSSDDLDDLDAALAALGIDVGRLPTVSPRHDPGADAGLDSNPGDPPPKGDRERSSDESDLVMSG